LLIDEGVGAGDQEFQEKLSRRVRRLLESAGLLVLASHSLDLLRTYCTRGLVLAHGEVQMIGALEEAIQAYTGTRHG
jgi:ABC-type polysaccharide/polyol phosphate transport system ATPase subunit